MADGSNNIWRNREDNHSKIIQAIVGPDMRFLVVVTGWPGSLSDAVALNSSAFCRLAKDGKVGKKIGISKETELGEYIVGDTGFPLMPRLLTPCQGCKLSDAEDKFNEQINAMNIVAKRALTRLKEIWRVINGAMWRPDKNRLSRIILHNIVLDLEGADVDSEELLSHEHDQGCGQQVCKSSDTKAADTREKFSLYLSGGLHP